MAICPPFPQSDCYEAAKAKLSYKETKPGREALLILWKGLGASDRQTGFGDPVNATSSVAVCIYDESGGLVEDLLVDRAGADCQERACWRPLKDKAYVYGDVVGSADGVSKLEYPQYLDNAAKGKALVKGKNNESEAQLSLPTGIAGALMGNTSATIQMITSYGFCASAVVQATTDKGDLFRAKKR